MAIVSRRGRRIENEQEDAESVMTAAAGGLRQRFMRRVAGKKSSSGSSGSDTDSDVEQGLSEKRKKKRTKSKSSTGTTSTSPTAAEGVKAAHEEKAEKERAAQASKRSASQEAGKKNSLALAQLEQAVPADAQLDPARVERFFEGLEGAPLGIITLEDVLEELIGEEIYDEYDEQEGPDQRTAASAFVPKEAIVAAKKAAEDRQARMAAETPLPKGDDDLDAHGAGAGQKRLGMGMGMGKNMALPKLPLPKFSLGKKPASTPGRVRTVDDGKVVPSVGGEGKRKSVDGMEGSGIKRTSSPGEIEEMVSVPAPTGNSPVAGLGLGSLAPEPASSLPARLAPTLAVPSGVPPLATSGPAVTPLTEAIRIGNKRRQISPAPFVRAQSARPYVGVQSESGMAGEGAGTGPTGAAGVAEVISPVARRVGKFKSVPTPIGTPSPGTPVIDEGSGRM
jgi:metal transporter CNNM